MDIKHACGVLLACLCLLITCTGFGQEYSYRQYTTKDGLASETVYNIIQDRNGFLWIGTASGLSRFDGRVFGNFTVADGLPSNEVFGGVEDATGRVWIICFSNQVAFYKNGKIYTRENDTLLRKLSFSKEIKGILEDKQKRVIIFDGSLNLALINPDGMIEKYKKGSFLLDYRELTINSTIDFFLLALPPEVSVAVSDFFKGNPLDVWDISATRISEQEILFVMREKALVWHMEQRHFTVLSHIPAEHYARKACEEGCLYRISSKGQGVTLVNYKQSVNKDRFLKGNIVNDILKDRDGHLWLSTKGNGLFKLNNMPVLHYDPQRENVPVQFVVRDSNGVLAGTEHKDYWHISIGGNGQFPGFPALKVNNNYVDRNLLLQKAERNPVKMHSSLVFNQYQGYLKSTFFFEHKVLQATSNAVFLVRDFKGNKPIPDTLLLGRATTAIHYGDYYYAGTLRGLVIYNEAYEKVATLTSYHITHISPGADSVLWVSTYGKGILKVKNNKVVAVINSKNNGLSSDFCNYVYADGSYLWAGTNKGLNKIDTEQPVPRAILLLTGDNGLRSDVVTTVLVKDTLVFVGTQKGLNMFNQRMAGQAPFFNFLFTAITVDNHVLPVDEAIVLPHDNNKISFDFTAISFSAENITYHYRILGLQDKWQETTERELHFLSLPSGKYTLQVKAVSALGGQTSLIEKQFEVQQSIYETWWFRLMVLLALGTLIYLFLKYRIRKVRKQEAEKSELSRKMTELEQMALRAQMNPHFIFNCLNSVQNYIVRKDSMGASIYLARFATLIRKTLDNAGSLYIPLKEELAYLESYIELEQLQANYPFVYRIEVAASINTAITAFPNMILQPYVENAIKHGLQYAGKNARLTINFTMKEGTQLVCRIEDNGPGIYTAKKIRATHHSKGMQITEQRVATLNQLSDPAIPIVLLIEDLADSGSSGTRISVTVPLKTI